MVTKHDKDSPNLPLSAYKPVLARIRSLLPHLTPAETSVAEILLGRSEDVGRLNVEGFAQRAGVSTATISRFCQSLGFKGFKDFKFALVAEMGSSPAILSEDVHADDTPMEIARKVFRADMQAIVETLELLDEEALNAAVDALEKAVRIEVYGVGSSAPIAVDAYYRLRRIGFQVGVVTDAHMQAVSAGLLHPEDAALVFSHTGRTRETLNTVRKAREAGATVIAITSFLRAPISELSDIVLVTAAAETAFRVEAMSSRIAHLSVVDALYVTLAVRRFDEARDILERTNAIISERRI